MNFRSLKVFIPLSSFLKKLLRNKNFKKFHHLAYLWRGLSHWCLLIKHLSRIFYTLLKTTTLMTLIKLHQFEFTNFFQLSSGLSSLALDSIPLNLIESRLFKRETKMKKTNFNFVRWAEEMRLRESTKL